MFLFLIAAGLSLIFGVLRVLNFAHGTFYMLGAYATYQLVQWMGVSGGRFWLTALGGALVVAALGGLIERFLFRRLYGKDELYQLLFTYALALILSDAAKMLWGTQQKSVSRPPELTGALHVFGAIIPHYNLFIILLGPAIALAFWVVLQRTRVGRYIRAAALDRETLGALGVNVDAARRGGGSPRAGGRLALLHVPRQRRDHLGALRDEPQPPGGLHGPRVLRPRRVLRYRRLHDRHPHEEARRAVPPRLPRRRRAGRRLRAAVRALLCAAHPHLLRDAHAGLRADRVGDLLQVERGHRRRAGHARGPLPRPRLDGGAAARARSADQRPLLPGDGRAGGAVPLDPAPRGALAVRADADDDPRERRARGVHRRPRAALRAGRVRAGGRLRRARRRPLRHLQPRRVPRLRVLDQVFRGPHHDAAGRDGDVLRAERGRAGPDLVEPADRLLHRVLAVRARHHPRRAAVRLSRRAGWRPRAARAPALEAAACLRCATSPSRSTASSPSRASRSTCRSTA